MKFMRAVVSVACCLGVAAPSVHAQTPTRWNDFKDLFRTFVQHDSIVGASALVMRDGKILDQLNLGFADRANHIAVDSATLFHWGSITKGLTAISIMQLRDRGKLNLDERIVDYVPELRLVHDTFGSIDSVTIRMLLSHTAGFQNPTWPYGEGKDWEPFEPTTWAQLVAMMPYQEIHFKPGSRYSYSNPGFIYLARVIEKITGDPWESYVQKNIFAPLALTKSYFRATPYYLAAHRSHNYSVETDTATNRMSIVDHGADFDPGITIPNGGWNAPLSDLARYVSFLLKPEMADVVFKPTTLAEMWQPVKPMSQGYQATADEWMGMSFFIHGTGDRRVLGHTGQQANFGSFFFFNPKTHVAVIAAYNTSNYDAAVLKENMEAKVVRAAIDLLRE